MTKATVAETKAAKKPKKKKEVRIHSSFKNASDYFREQVDSG